VYSASREGISWLGHLDLSVERMLHGAEGQPGPVVLESVGDQFQPEGADEALVVVALVVDKIFEQVFVQLHVCQHLSDLGSLPVLGLVAEVEVQNFVGKIDFAEELRVVRPEKII